VNEEDSLVEQYRKELQRMAVGNAVSRGSSSVDEADYRVAYDRLRRKPAGLSQAAGASLVFLAGGFLAHGFAGIGQSSWPPTFTIIVGVVLGLMGIVIRYNMLRLR